MECLFCFLIIRRPPRSTRTHSFPTRRSSDLFSAGAEERQAELEREFPGVGVVAVPVEWTEAELVQLRDEAFGAMERSEEHTSELQSLMRISYAVFCLKKKRHKCIQPLSEHSQRLSCSIEHTYTDIIST